jgi:tetratricopeptide (TPR) repeat protein
MLVRIARPAVAASILLLVRGGLAPVAAQPPANPESGHNASARPQDVLRLGAQFDEAIHLQRAHRVPEALAAYRAFIRLVGELKIAPQNALPAFRNIAILYQQQGIRKAAERSWQDVLSVSPRNAEAMASLALLYSEDGRIRDARAAATMALSFSPNRTALLPIHLTFGNCALAGKDYPAAETEFRKAIRIAPQSPVAYLNLGVALTRQRRYPQALAAMKKARDLGAAKQANPIIAMLEKTTGAPAQPKATAPADVPAAIAACSADLLKRPNDPDLLFRRGLLYHQEGKSQEAITDYLAALQSRPGFFGAELNVGQLYAEIENFPAADLHLKRAAALKPESVPALTLLGYAEMREASQTSGQQQSALYRDSEAALKRALARSPKEKEALSTLGFLYEQMNRFDDATALYRRMKEAEPDKMLPYFRLARVCLEQRDVDGAVSVWKEYRARRPDEAISYEESARALEGGARQEAAISEWKELLARQPQNAGAMVAIARDLAVLKRPAEARAEYEAVLALPAPGPGTDPHRLPAIRAALDDARESALRSLAQLAAKEKKTEEAVSWWTKLGEAQSATAARTGQAAPTEPYLEIARLWERDKQPDKAIAALKELLRVAPLDSDAHLELAGLYASRKRLDDAAVEYRNAARNAKNPVQVRLQLATMFETAGRLDRAYAELTELRNEHPADPQALRSWADAAERTGRTEEALSAYRDALKADPNARWALEREGVVLSRLKRYPEARAALERRVDLALEDPQAYADLAEAYRLEGNPDGYLAWLKARLESRPAAALLTAIVDVYAARGHEDEGLKLLYDWADAHKTDRRYLKSYATALMQRRLRTRAIEVYRELLAHYPADVDAAVSLVSLLDLDGRLAAGNEVYEALLTQPGLTVTQRSGVRQRLVPRLIRLNRSGDVIKLLEEGYRADPQDLRTAIDLARRLNGAGRTEEAIGIYRNIAGRKGVADPVRALMLTELGDIYQKQGRKQDAVAAYRKALELAPGTADAATGLRRLGEQP